MTHFEKNHVNLLDQHKKYRYENKKTNLNLSSCFCIFNLWNELYDHSSAASFKRHDQSFLFKK